MRDAYDATAILVELSHNGRSLDLLLYHGSHPSHSTVPKVPGSRALCTSVGHYEGTQNTLSQNCCLIEKLTSSIASVAFLILKFDDTKGFRRAIKRFE